MQNYLFNVINEYYQKSKNCDDCQRICDDIKIAVTELRSILPTLTIDNIEVTPKMILTKERIKKTKKGSSANGCFIVKVKDKPYVEKN